MSHVQSYDLRPHIRPTYFPLLHRERKIAATYLQSSYSKPQSPRAPRKPPPRTIYLQPPRPTRIYQIPQLKTAAPPPSRLYLLPANSSFISSYCSPSLPSCGIHLPTPPTNPRYSQLLHNFKPAPLACITTDNPRIITSPLPHSHS